MTFFIQRFFPEISYKSQRKKESGQESLLLNLGKLICLKRRLDSHKKMLSQVQGGWTYGHFIDYSVALSSKQSLCGLPVTLWGPYTTEERNAAYLSHVSALNSQM